MISADDLQGHWRLSRRITDHAADQAGHFGGQAVFTPMEDGLAYREEGLLRFGTGPAFTATRRYLWRWDGGLIAVFFADGTDFHRFAASERQPQADHHCSPDHYRVAYDFTHFPDWTCTWRVTGPRKDYRMQSHYSRAPEP